MRNGERCIDFSFLFSHLPVAGLCPAYSILYARLHCKVAYKTDERVVKKTCDRAFRTHCDKEFFAASAATTIRAMLPFSLHLCKGERYGVLLLLISHLPGARAKKPLRIVIAFSKLALKSATKVLFASLVSKQKLLLQDGGATLRTIFVADFNCTMLINNLLFCNFFKHFVFTFIAYLFNIFLLLHKL